MQEEQETTEVEEAQDEEEEESDREEESKKEEEDDDDNEEEEEERGRFKTERKDDEISKIRTIPSTSNNRKAIPDKLGMFPTFFFNCI